MHAFTSPTRFRRRGVALLHRLTSIGGAIAVAAMTMSSLDVAAPGAGGGAAVDATPVVETPVQPVAYARPTAPNPFRGARTYIDPESDPARAAAAEDDPERARLLRKVASGGGADWYGDWNPTSELRATVARRVETVTAAGAMPVLVAYNVPHRDCGSWSAGGAHTGRAYRRWIDELAAGIGDRRAAVVLEPDALAGLDCLAPSAQAQRYRLLGYAVRTLGSRPAVATYLDAGHAAWHGPAVMADRLRLAGVRGARGFALNVSNYGRTEDQVTYGREISSLTGRKRFVVDTSRNGLGPSTGDNSWCNPSGRALGERPLSPDGSRRVDALLWIKLPGQSDGDCGRGEPAAGVFWTDYAVGLASRTTW